MFEGIKFNLNSINTYLQEKGINVSEEESKNLKSIFEKYDIANEKGEQEADGVLNRSERAGFLRDVQQQCSNLWQQIRDFAINVDSSEEVQKTKQETFEEISRENKIPKTRQETFEEVLQENEIRKTKENYIKEMKAEQEAQQKKELEDKIKDVKPE